MSADREHIGRLLRNGPDALIEYARRDASVAQPSLRAYLAQEPPVAVADRLASSIALGWCCQELGFPTEADEVLEAARLEAATHGETRLERLALVAQFGLAGRLSDAERIVELGDRLLVDADPAERPALRASYATYLGRIGDFDRADALFRAALDDHPEPELPRARSLNNWASHLIRSGRPDQAVRVLNEATGIPSDDNKLAAFVRHNLGVAMAGAGELRAGLVELDRAAEILRDSNARIYVGVSLTDRADLLLRAGLLTEARDAIDESMSLLEGGGAGSDLLLAKLTSIQISVAADDYQQARLEAKQARTMSLEYSGQSSLARRSFSLAAVLDWLVGASEPPTDPLSLEGDQDLLFDVLAHLFSRRDCQRMRELLPSVVDQKARTHSFVAETQRLLGHCYLSYDTDDPMVCLPVVHQLLNRLEQRMATMGVSDFQHRTRRRLSEATDLGVAALIDSDQLDQVVGLVERSGRALVPDPPLSEELTPLLTHLRETAAAFDVTENPTPAQHIALRQAERALTAARRTQLPDPPTGLAPSGPPAEAETLLLRCDRGNVQALWRSGRSDWTTATVTSIDEFDSATRMMRLACEASAYRASDSSVALAQAERFRELLLAAGLPLLVGGVLHVMSDERLPPVPWPLVSDRPIQLVTSAAYRPTSQPERTTRRGVLVGGGNLQFARSELDGIEDHSAGVDWTRPEPVVEEIMAVLPKTDIAHLAAHGHIRSDDPYLSWLDLIDGRLTFLDLMAGLGPDPPDTIVLAACNLDRRSTQNPAGLATTLVGRGVRHVVAANGAVGDEASAQLFVAAYARLASDGLLKGLWAEQKALVATEPGVALFSVYGHWPWDDQGSR